MNISGFALGTITVKPGAAVTVTNADTAARTLSINGTQIDVNVRRWRAGHDHRPYQAGQLPPHL